MDGVTSVGMAHGVLSALTGADVTTATALFDGAHQAVGTFVNGALRPIRSFINGTARLSWPFMIIMIAAAFGCYLYQRTEAGRASLKGFIGFLKLREVYLHPSSLLDYRYILINGGVKALIIAPVAGVSVVTGSGIVLMLQSLFGEIEPLSSPGFGTLLAYSLAMLMAVDLGNYWHHRVFHTVPALWELHKVHHSAPVLNPATASRTHPLESLSNKLFAGMFAGVSMGAFYYVWGDIGVLKAFGINVFLLYTHSVSGNLRHSHIWLSYGPRLEHVISSPAQHQIHHSDDPKHFNLNYATHFSFWDWVFGTLYTTTPKPEKLTFGIGPEGREFNSVLALWLRPLQAIGRLRPTPPPAPTPQPDVKPAER